MSAVPAVIDPPTLEPVPPHPPRNGAGLAARLMRLHIRDIAIFGIFMAIAAMALKPVVDNDVFWHLATGRYMWTTGRIPHNDPFSWTAPGKAWIAHEWLTELWLYPLYLHGGFGALMLVFAAVIVAAFVAVYGTARQLGATRAIGASITLLAAVACYHTWGVRPQMLSMALMALTLWLLVRETAGTPFIRRAGLTLRGAWLLPPLMAVWANLHGGFIFGLALVGAFAIGQSCAELWERLAGNPAAQPAQSARLWKVLALCVAACLLNPNGVQGLIYPFSYLGDNASTRYIAEWVSPDFHKFQYHFFEALLLLLIVGATLTPRGARRGIRVPAATQLLLLLAFTHLALDSVRNINLFSAIVAPFIAAYLSLAWRERGGRDAHALRPGPAVTRGKALMNLGLAAFIALAVLAVRAPDLSAARNASAQARLFPAGAVAYMTRHHLSGRLLNSYDWGGYLIWSMYPRQRVYVDGRPDMYGDRFVDDFIHTWQAQPGWQATLQRRGVRLVLVEPTSGLGHALSTAHGWRLAYHDSVSVLYERTA